MTDQDPDERFDPSKWAYDQAMSTLDLAWDRYYELTAFAAAPGEIDLSRMHVPHHALSRLFDIAITAYRQAVEGNASDVALSIAVLSDGNVRMYSKKPRPLTNIVEALRLIADNLESDPNRAPSPPLGGNGNHQYEGD